MSERNREYCDIASIPTHNASPRILIEHHGRNEVTAKDGKKRLAQISVYAYSRRLSCGVEQSGSSSGS